MARKNPFATLSETRSDPTPVLDYTIKGASRSLANSISEISTRAQKLTQGETIVELDPDTVDASFVQDRLAADDKDFDDLLTAIREQGQTSPILVRPHPKSPSRYMVVFGHRRLRAARELGRPVRAVVKELKDRDHVIAQGQENYARANLSFIERATFAGRLVQLNYDADNATVMAALGVDKTTLSKMLSVAALPDAIRLAIGPAKSVGRDPWYELKLLLEKPSIQDAALQIITQEEFTSRSSDDRFHFLISALKASTKTRRKLTSGEQTWSPPDGSLSAKMSARGKQFTLDLKAKGGDAAAFGRYLSENLAGFYESFRQASGKSGD